MKCPCCYETLVKSERQDFKIDYCPNCCGVWLYRSELEKLAQHLSSGRSNGFKIPPQFNNYGSNDNLKPIKERNWLNELFN